MTNETAAKTHSKLTKAEMIERLAEIQGMTKIDTSRVIDALFEALRAGLLEDRVIELRGLGTGNIPCTRSSTPAPPICWRTGRISTMSRSCWVTNA
jgi:hypothetical protein